VPRPAGPVKGGKTIIAFAKDPTGYSFELIQREGQIKEPFAQVGASACALAGDGGCQWVVADDGACACVLADDCRCRWVVAEDGVCRWVVADDGGTFLVPSLVTYPSPPPPMHTRPQVMLRVSNLERSIQYYTEALGMTLLRTRENSGEQGMAGLSSGIDQGGECLLRPARCLPGHGLAASAVWGCTVVNERCVLTVGEA